MAVVLLELGQSRSTSSDQVPSILCMVRSRSLLILVSGKLKGKLNFCLTDGVDHVRIHLHSYGVQHSRNIIDSLDWTLKLMLVFYR